MSGAVIADTGPLVAIFDRGDEHHEWAKGGLGRITEPLLTVEAVLSEALFLLRDMPYSRSALLEFWSEGGVRTGGGPDGDEAALIGLLRKYSDKGISLADAALVRLSERHPGCPVWTLDEDFRIYRRLGRRVIPLFEWPK